MRGVWVLVLLAACIKSSLVPCDDQLCPIGTTCTLGGCASPTDVAACNGKQEGDACTTDAIMFDGYCVGGACHQSACGNGVLEGGEVCDDGNREFADGCSGRCDSTEVCGNGIPDPLTGEECDSGVPGRSGDGCTSTCSVELDMWDVTPARSFVALADAAIATDLNRNRIVLFGGNDGVNHFDNTWELEGTRWQLRFALVHPSARRNAAMAYDEPRHRIILFGGQDNFTIYADTWEWDGIDWRQITPPTSPPPRTDASMAFDPVTQHVIMYGGWNGNALDDMWSFDGTTWSEITPPDKPGIRFSAAMTREPTGGVLLVGGRTAVGVVEGATYRWDGTTWTQTAQQPPAARAEAGAAYDPICQCAVIYAGSDLSGDIWAYQSDGTWATYPNTLTGARTRVALAFDPVTSSLVTVGGLIDGTATNETRRLDEATWTWGAAFTTPFFFYRYNAVVAYEPLQGLTIMEGGLLSQGGPPGTVLSDAWAWDGGQWRWLGSAPQRAEHAMAFDGVRRQLLMFGGYNSSALDVANTSVLNGSTWQSLSPATSPPARRRHAMAYDAERHVIVLFGGISGTTTYADTWEWDGTTWTQRMPATSPPPRSAHVMTYDLARRRTVLFGGVDATNTPVASTWEWDGTNWEEKLPQSSPPARSTASLTYNVDRQRVLLYGGMLETNLAADDTWEWDGTNWTRRTTPLKPTARRRGNIAYDPIRSRTYAFMGTNTLGSAVTEIGSYSFTSAESPLDACTDKDTDGDELAGCADPDCWGRCDPLCPPGVNATCDADRPRCGDGTCSVLEDFRLCPGDCPP